MIVYITKVLVGLNIYVQMQYIGLSPYTVTSIVFNKYYLYIHL